MSIKFFCKCGKHLRARETLAGKRSVCPACGELVGVPSLAPTHRGTAAAPLSAEEKAKLGRPMGLPVPATSTDQPHPPGAPQRKLSWRRARRVLSLERHWYECLRFPLYAAPLLAPLALGLTVLSGLTALAFSELSAVEIRSTGVLAVCWVAPLLTFGCTCGFLQCVLASAAAGETGLVPGLGSELVIVRALPTWIVCLLAGPIVFFAAGFWFWFHAGDPTLFDWLIVIELGLVGAGHWLLTLVAVQQSGRLRDANPVRVGDLIRRMGYTIVLATLGAAAVGLLFGLFIVKALQFMHDEFIASWLLLFAAWLGGLALVTFFFRLLGLWCFWSRVEECQAAPPGKHAAAAIASRPSNEQGTVHPGERRTVP